MTAAHRTLPFNTVVRVKNKANGKEVDVRINDRGPFIAGRIIDLSVRAARAIDMLRPGVVLVKLKILSQGTVPRRTALGTPLDAVQVGTLEPLRADDDLVVSRDHAYERTTQ
jgi:rare lipoprotein A